MLTVVSFNDPLSPGHTHGPQNNPHIGKSKPRSIATILFALFLWKLVGHASKVKPRQSENGLLKCNLYNLVPYNYEGDPKITRVFLYRIFL